MKAHRRSIVWLPLFVNVCCWCRADTLIVDPAGGPGSFAEVQEAIDAAAPGDTVLIKRGEYAITRPLTFLGKAITVRGEEGPRQTTIRMGDRPADPDRASVVIFEDGEGIETLLEGVTLTGGSGTRDAEGIDVRHGGGVLVVNNASPTLLNCHIVENHLRFGASASGGGVYCTGASVQLVECLIADNSAPSRGGGVECEFGASGTLTECIIARNFSHKGGAARAGHDAAMTLSGCTVTGNSSDRGAIECANGSLTMTACTVAGNVPNVVHGGTTPEPKGVRLSNTTAVITGSIIWENGPESLSNSGGSLEVTYSCIQGDLVWPGTGNINDDPLFCGWGDTAEVWVNADAPGPGDGSEQSPFPELGAGIDFSLALAPTSPCLGAGEGGADVGSAQGACQTTPSAAGRVVHLAPGDYEVSRLSATRGVSLLGAGSATTRLEGLVSDLKTGTILSGLSIRALHVAAGEAPEIDNCTISGSERDGVIAGSDSSPILNRCTVTGNQGSALLCEAGSAPSVMNSIFWDNLGGAIVAARDSGPDVTYSCVEGDEVFPGMGNLNDDPLFCGWGTAEDVYVDSAAAEPGDDSEANAFADLAAALRGYRPSLSGGSPCLGSGAGGVDMGADNGPCAERGTPTRRIHLAAGVHPISGRSLVHSVSLLGGDEETTIVQGTVRGLRTGAVLSHLTVTGGTQGGIIVSGAAPEISHCTISGNRTDDVGGGVLCVNNAAPVFRSCTISENSAGDLGGDGGGLFSRDSSLTLIDCTITRNWRSGMRCQDSVVRMNNCSVLENYGLTGNGEGGGIEVNGVSSATLESCSIRGNVAFIGGGISIRGETTAVLSHCTVSGNSASESAGGINLEDSPSVTITGSTISGNQAEAGRAGGVRVRHNSTVELTNSAIFGNRSNELGGGLLVESDATALLVNCTISGNRSRQGGGVFCADQSVATLTNCIVWSNIPNSVRRATGSLELTHSAVQGGWPGVGNLRLDPHFQENGEFRFDRHRTVEIDGKQFEVPDFIVTPPDFHLQARSPATDAGTAHEAAATDIEGTERPCWEGFDMGAYEYCGETAPGPRFLRGDCDSDLAVDVADAIFNLRFLFTSKDFPSCFRACDANADRLVDISDVSYIVNFVFAGAPAPPPPFPDCGRDLDSERVLGCEQTCE